MPEAGLAATARPEAALPAAAAFVLALGAMPTLVFALLVGFGALRPLLGVLAWGICTAVAVGFGAMLGRDIVLLGMVFAELRTDAETVAKPRRLLVPGMPSLGQQAAQVMRAERLTRATHLERGATDHALLERLPDALFRLDKAGAIVWRNASALSTFGGETAALLRHPELRAALAQAGAMGEAVRRNIILAAPVARELDATVLPVGGAVYLLVTDRTRERSVEKMRADFVANSSHELRTPLASLIGFIETLQGPAADDVDAQKRFLGIMAEQAMRMQRVIADLLSLSKIEISEHQPPTEILRLPPLLERIAAGMEPMLADNGTRIKLVVPEDLPAVPADADQLAQVFTNLLDNAIKYGKRGGCVTVTARAARGDVRFEPHGVLVTVADDGAGIAREHIPRLTERFYRVDKGRSRTVGGTGLGLAIVKHVVNRHRGRMMIESAEGRGTEITIWLPASV